MKTINRTTLLSVVLTWSFCFAPGCQQQTAQQFDSSVKTVDKDDSNQPSSTDAPSTETPPTGTGTHDTGTHGTGTHDTDASENDTPLITSGTPEITVDLSDQDTQIEPPAADTDDPPTEPTEPTIDIPTTWKPLSPTQEIWLDAKKKQVIVGGKVCLSGGPLEMLICPRSTKEHESIVSINADSWQVHAAIVALGSSPGVPCRWAPEYSPAWGPSIEIEMMWRDPETQEVKTIDGKQWILNTDTQKPMTTPLVFGGSYSEPQFEGEQPRYQANDGELICLANFSSSTIDLHVSKKDTDIFFEANTPLIPPINTQVYAIIKPGPVLGKPAE